MALKQKDRLLSLTTPLGGEVLVLTAFSGREELSRLFSYQLDMISDNNAITAKDIVGKNVTWSAKLKDGTPRNFNGLVSRFYAGDERHGRRNYRAEVVPWLWFLTRTADCRIFQNKTVKEIVEQIFQDLGFSDFDTGQVKGSHPKRDYCVQYRETDFNFVSRLMEEEGIFYFFKHDSGKHQLVLGDQKGAYVDCVEKEVDYPPDFGSRAMEDFLTTWEHHYQFRTGKWAQTDYNFETPSTSLMTNTKSVVSLPGIDKYEVYDYPGEYGKTSDGNGLTKLRMEEEEAGYDIVYATSVCKSFTPGGKFKVRQHRSSSEEKKSYVITAIEHRAVEPTSYETGSHDPGRPERDYSNRFSCIPDAVVFRPERSTRRPPVQGLQTAVVVGPAGEEIYPDKYGRVKVQFPWDREGKKDEKSSCWVRVSQIHAGKGFGGIDIPRIGEEVIVAFLEGDPDQPIIVGRVYHAENMPPYGLPDAKTICGIKSKTYKGSGYNEYIMDDTPGKELIRVHGQYDKDSTIEHDLREHVLHDRSRDVTNNESIQIGVDRTETVGSNESLTVGKNRTESIGANETLSVASNRTRTVGGQRNRDRGPDADAFGGHQRGHHGGRRPGDHGRGAALGDRGCQPDRQCRCQSQHQRRLQPECHHRIEAERERRQRSHGAGRWRPQVAGRQERRAQRGQQARHHRRRSDYADHGQRQHHHEERRHHRDQRQDDHARGHAEDRRKSHGDQLGSLDEKHDQGGHGHGGSLRDQYDQRVPGQNQLNSSQAS